MMQVEDELTRSTPPQIREEDVVGFEEVVKLLLNEVVFHRTGQFSFLYILGMGGIGKTTLSVLLYNHADVASRFEIRAWVNVSAASTAIEILMELSCQLRIEDEPEMITELNEEDLARRVRWHLEGRASFIVFDGVWSENQLNPFLHILPRAAHKNIMVITSRKNEGIVRYEGYVHQMKPLDPNKSWELFLKKVFNSYRKCPNHLESIGKEIVRKCDGLPLAIQEAGTKLAKRTESKSEWEDFLETMDLSETLTSLELSYHSLSEKLKSCFSSLAFFKEGTTIRVDKLEQIWIAGGMVSQMDYENEIWALNELIRNNLLQFHDDRSKDSRKKNSDINYNLHRLAVKKAKEELSFEVITTKESNYQSSRKPRHRAICCSREKLSYSTNEDKHLVSLFFRGGGNFDASPLYWESFELLKILDFEYFGLKTLPEMVGAIFTLKYLGLRNNFLQKLPHSLEQLVKLQVLDIAQNFMVEVPNIIMKMESLRHLYMSNIICRELLKIDKLYNLETLTYISINKWAYEASELKMMTSLRKLGIEEVDENSNVRKLFASIAELERLENLILRGFRFRSMAELNELYILRGLRKLKLDGRLTRLPSANNFPRNLECLTLTNSCLDEDPMPVLEKLSWLYYLKLRNAFNGEQMVISHNGFQELQILCIEELWHLRSVQVGEGAIRWVVEIEIKNCPYLKTLPKEKGLKKVKMVTTKEIAAKIRESSFNSKVKEVDIQP